MLVWVLTGESRHTNYKQTNKRGEALDLALTVLRPAKCFTCLQYGYSVMPPLDGATLTPWWLEKEEWRDIADMRRR